MKKIKFIVGLLLSATCLIACGKKEVKLNMTTTLETEEATTYVNDLADLNDKEWKEDFTYTDSALSKPVTVKFDLKTKVSPSVKNISVMKIVPYEFTPENKEKFVKTLFGDDFKEYYIEDFVNYEEDKLVLSDGFEGNVYKGCIDGSSKETTLKFISIFDDINCIEFVYSEYENDVLAVPDITISFDEQFEIVNKLFVESGMIEEGKGMFDKSSEEYQRLFEENKAGSENGFNRFYYLGDPFGYDETYAIYQSSHNACMYFDDKILLYGYINSPVIITSYEKYDRILSVESIQKILKETLENGNRGKLFVTPQNIIKINKMELTYWEYEEDGVNVIAPVWMVGDYQMIINAVTGEIIPVDF